MAYNLVPLIQILEQILHPLHHNGPNWIIDPRKKPSLESILDRARFVEDFFQNTSTVTDPEVRGLECRTRDAACRSLCSIESLLADQFISEGKDIEISPPDYLLQLINCEFEGIVDNILEIKVERKWRAVSSLSNPPPSNLITSTPDLNPTNILVGISQDLEQLKDQIIKPQQSQLEIIPIVGMGGIGKTTLARTLYDDQVVASYFDKRAWIVISQSYDVREILLGILKCIIRIFSDEIVEEDIPELALRIYKILYGRRYLIVLDDMWSIEAWECISQSFPDDNNGSRILVTTREQGVANKVVGSTNLQHKMKLLNDITSWELLRKKVFPEGRSCEAELEVVGRNIAKGCKGLPLAIHVVGGFLSRLEYTQDAWTQVAMDITSLAKNDSQVSNILSLSYNHLPNYLKPCFLYLGALPNYRVIKPSGVIRLWMAEGFLNPIPDMSLEETGRVYLTELVERSLLSVGRQQTKGKVKSYIMHDLLRGLCISKAHEDRFLHSIDAIKDLNPNEMLRLRLTSDYWVERTIGSPGIPSDCRLLAILLFYRGISVHELTRLDNAFGGLQLLKVLNFLKAGSVEELPKRLLNLRYLAAHLSSSTYSISNLWNLQTLIFYLDREAYFHLKVKELLDMPQLRHVKFKGNFPLFVLKDG